MFSFIWAVAFDRPYCSCVNFCRSFYPSFIIYRHDLFVGLFCVSYFTWFMSCLISMCVLWYLLIYFNIYIYTIIMCRKSKKDFSNVWEWSASSTALLVCLLETMSRLSKKHCCTLHHATVAPYFTPLNSTYSLFKMKKLYCLSRCICMYIR